MSTDPSKTTALDYVATMTEEELTTFLAEALAAGQRQVLETELAKMTPEQINWARKHGKLDHLLGVKPDGKKAGA